MGKTLTKAAFTGNPLGGYQPSMGMQTMFHPAMREGRMAWTDVLTMTMHPTVTIGLKTLLAPFPAVQWKVESNSKEVSHFVDDSLHQFWMADLQRILMHYYVWGTVPAAATYRYESDRHLMRYEALDEVYPFETRARVRGTGRKVHSFSVPGAHATGPSKTPWIESPHKFWMSHTPRIGSPYGVSRLSAAWAPWMEQSGAKGAKDSRRLWMWKCAFSGGRIWFQPGGSFEDENGKIKSNEDYAREIVEKSESGAVMAFPAIYDEHNNLLWKYEDAKVNGMAGDLLSYPEKLDGEILWGMGVFPELVKAAETAGGWSGRSVPLLIFLSSADSDVRDSIAAFDRDVLRPMVLFNFGEKARYKITPESLVPKAPPADDGKGGAQPGQGTTQPGQPGGPPPQAGGGDQPSGGSPQAIMGAAQGAGGMGGAGPVKMSGAPVLAEVVALPTNAENGFVPVDDELLSMILKPLPMPEAIGLSSIADKIKQAAAATERDPSEAAKVSGNYRKGKVTLHGLPITIETPKGAYRSGCDPDGNEWRTKMGSHYGYIRGTESEADSDHVDCFIGPEAESEIVFVIDQCKADGSFDEAKCMLGYTSEADARAGYLACYSDGWKCGTLTAMTMGQFKAWLADGDTSRPVADQSILMSAHHAPIGGITIAGEFFPGGRFITAQTMKKATPEERRDIQGDNDSKRDATKPSSEHSIAVDSAEKPGTPQSVHFIDYDGKKNLAMVGDSNFPRHYGDVVFDSMKQAVKDMGTIASEGLEDAFNDPGPDEISGIQERIGTWAKDAIETLHALRDERVAVHHEHIGKRYGDDAEMVGRDGHDKAVDGLKTKLSDAVTNVKDIFDDLAGEGLEDMDEDDRDALQEDYQERLSEALSELDDAVYAVHDGLTEANDTHTETIDEAQKHRDGIWSSQASDAADELNDPDAYDPSTDEGRTDMEADARTHNQRMASAGNPNAVWWNDDGDEMVVMDAEDAPPEAKQGPDDDEEITVPDHPVEMSGAWKEDEHPRGHEGNAGEFAKNGEQSDAGPKERKPIYAPHLPPMSKHGIGGMMKIAGELHHAGQEIHPDTLAKATPEELAAIHGGEQASQARKDWAARQVARDSREASLDAAAERHGDEDERTGVANEVIDAHRKVFSVPGSVAADDDISESIAEASAAPAKVAEHFKARWDAVGAHLQAAGATDKELAPLTRAVERGSAIIGKKIGAYVAQAAKVKQVNQDLLDESRRAEPEEPEGPNYPDEPEEQDYLEEPAAATAAHEKAVEQADKNHEKAVAKWEKEHDRWEQQREKAVGVFDKANDVLEERHDDLHEAWEEQHSNVTDAYDEIEATLRDRLSDEGDADEEPEEADEPDAPVEMSGADSSGHEHKSKGPGGGQFVSKGGGGATADKPAPKGPGRVSRAVSKAAAVAHHAREAVDRVTDKHLPTLKRPTMKVLKAAYITHTAANGVVQKVAQRRGMSKEGAGKLAACLTAIDATVGAKVMASVVGGAIVAATGSVGIGVAGGLAASFVPLVSLGYLMASPAMDAAKAAVKKVMQATRGKPVAMSAAPETGGSMSPQDHEKLVEAMADRLEQLGDRFDGWQLCFLAALEQGQPPMQALLTADAAVEHMPDPAKKTGQPPAAPPIPNAVPNKRPAAQE